MQSKLITEFRAIYKKLPEFFIRAPGRVNLIGEHTDYNEGFVLPMTIDLAVWMAVSTRLDDRIDLYSLDFNARRSFHLQSLRKRPKDSWLSYTKGVAWAMRKIYPQNTLRGFDAVICSDLPRGACLSSSAAFELAIAFALSKSSSIKWLPKEMALLCQKAENDWVGMHCGIMDQLVIALGKKDCAVAIDCRSLTTKMVHLPSVQKDDDVTIVIMDTTTRRGLVNSVYNDRRKACFDAARILSVKSLRDISVCDWKTVEQKLPDFCRSKAKHVIFENERVHQAVQALEKKEWQRLGELFYESHKSLRDDFEVSSKALDKIVEIAMKSKASFGARMTGAGFGGCAIALVKLSLIDDFIAYVTEKYCKATKLNPTLYVTHATDGARAFS